MVRRSQARSLEDDSVQMFDSSWVKLGMLKFLTAPAQSLLFRILGLGKRIDLLKLKDLAREK